jgi:hypothetical protein
VLDRCLVGIIDLDHLGITLNGVSGALRIHSQGSTQHIMNNLLIRWILYLAGKDDDLLDDSSSLVLEELLNDVTTNGTCPSDGEVRVSRHELTLLSTVRVIFSLQMLRGSSIYPLSEPRGLICHSHTVMVTKSLGPIPYVHES